MSPLYPRPPVYVVHCLRGQCRLLHPFPWNHSYFSPYNYIHTGNGPTCTYTGSTTVQCAACTGSCHGNQYGRWDENGKMCAKSGTQNHISGIPGQCTTIICLSRSLPQNSVQTTTTPMQADPRTITPNSGHIIHLGKLVQPSYLMSLLRDTGNKTLPGTPTNPSWPTQTSDW